MGNSESSSVPGPEPVIRESSRPLRSILRQTSTDSDSQRRNVVFADQPDSLPGQHVRFTYQPFAGTAAASCDSITHFGADIREEEEDEAMETELNERPQVLQLTEAQRRRKKRAPAPPPRRDSITSLTPRPPIHRESVTPIACESPQPQPNFDDLRKRLKLDLQESRKEYERLKNLRQPLQNRRKDEPRYVDRIYHHLKAQREATDDKTVTPASSTETLKGAQAGPRRDAPRVVDMRRFKDLDHEEDASNKWLQETKQMLEELDLEGKKQLNGLSQSSLQRRNFTVGADRQWSCQSSDSGISNTLPPELEEHGSSVLPNFVSSSSSLASAPGHIVAPPPPFRSSSRSLSSSRARSEADMVPTFRLPNPPHNGPLFSSTEPLFAFDERPASELGFDTRRPHRRVMNESLRRMRSSIGRMFGSIGRLSHSASLKRRPVSMANFDSPADVYYSQHGPLEAWQITGSVMDVSEAEMAQTRRQRPRSTLDEHFDNVWHDVVRTSHEQLRLSNPSFFEESSNSGSREVLGISSSNGRLTGRLVKQTWTPYKSGTIR